MICKVAVGGCVRGHAKNQRVRYLAVMQVQKIWCAVVGF